mmetsp:Transcript_25955/g.60169  ORF Transcript_25955/g.60169 Transcript_25955/m.60169 type:complete len:425 (-) Transcript_25955:95-1369(-)
MLQRGLLTRILYPAPEPSYALDSFPGELVWVPKRSSLDGDVPPVGVDSVPCLLLRYPYSRFLVLFFHSNAEDLGRCYSFCRMLRDNFQVHVLAVEYPGYGLCPGVATGQSVMENALSALHFATQSLAWPLDSIKVFGRSIGTGPAIKLASLFRFAGLILVTPFLSVAELFKDRVGLLSNLIEEWYPNLELVSKITCPVLVIHGKADSMIDFSHTEKLYTEIPTRKLLVSPVAMTHNTNLMNDVNYLVLPATSFFSLPDYAFQDLKIPPWALDKRRCTASRLGSWSVTLRREGEAILKMGEQLKTSPRMLLGSKMITLESCCGSGSAKPWLPSLGVDSCCSRVNVDQYETADGSQVGYDPGAMHPCGIRRGDPVLCMDDPAEPIAVSMPALAGQVHREEFHEEEVVHHARVGVRQNRDKRFSISV